MDVLPFLPIYLHILFPFIYLFYTSAPHFIYISSQKILRKKQVKRKMVFSYLVSPYKIQKKIKYNYNLSKFYIFLNYLIFI